MARKRKEDEVEVQDSAEDKSENVIKSKKNSDGVTIPSGKVVEE